MRKLVPILSAIVMGEPFIRDENENIKLGNLNPIPKHTLSQNNENRSRAWNLYTSSGNAIWSLTPPIMNHAKKNVTSMKGFFFLGFQRFCDADTLVLLKYVGNLLNSSTSNKILKAELYSATHREKNLKYGRRRFQRCNFLRGIHYYVRPSCFA